MSAFDRMLGYLPPYWHQYLEMTLVQKTLGEEIDALNARSEVVLRDAFIMTMGEERIKEWEHWLKLPPTGTIEDRRLAILEYFSVISKLSKESIQVMVSRLYKGSRAIVRFKDSKIKITIKPLPEHDLEEIDFSLLHKQLERRLPCHIGLHTDRYISTWGEVNLGVNSWEQIQVLQKTWQGVYDYIRE